MEQSSNITLSKKNSKRSALRLCAKCSATTLCTPWAGSYWGSYNILMAKCHLKLTKKLLFFFQHFHCRHADIKVMQIIADFSLKPSRFFNQKYKLLPCARISHSFNWVWDLSVWMLCFVTMCVRSLSFQHLKMSQVSGGQERYDEKIFYRTAYAQHCMFAHFWMGVDLSICITGILYAESMHT